MEKNSPEYFFRLPKNLQMLVGIWPYSNPIRKICLRSFCALLIIIMLIPQLRDLPKNLVNAKDVAFYNIAYILYFILSSMKILTSIVAEEKIKYLFDNINNNWKLIQLEDEKEILINVSKEGLYVIKLYLGILVWGFSVFLLFPLFPRIFDLINPKDEPRIILYLVGGDVGFNKSNHYYKLYIFESLNMSMTGFLIAAVDITYMACVFHCVGLFAIIAHRLRKLGKLEEIPNIDVSYKWLADTISLHQKVILCADTLENTYSDSFLVLTGLNLIYLSVLSILIVINLADSNQINFIRGIVVTAGCVFQMFTLSFPGQKLIDYSSGIYFEIYNNHWYDSSKQMKTLMSIMFLRSYKRCQLTAGGLYIMSFENFASVLKTSISYITVLASFR